MKITRRASLIAAAAAVVLGASACGSTDADPGTTAPAADAFPVTIEHLYGETVIEAQPERVATVSWVNADIALALGVVPAGMDLDIWGQNENGSTDWKDARLEELGAPIGSENAPVQYDPTDGINFEEIAKVAPDVILAPYSGLTREEYDKLSRIAPVVGPLAENYTAQWQDSTQAIGEALGKSAEAGQVIADVESKIAAAADANPVFQDTTFIAGDLTVTEGSLSVYAGGDNRPRFLTALGMTQAPVVEENTPSGQFYFPWAAERANELESDVFFTWVPAGTTNEAIAADPLIGQIPGIKNGGLIATSDDQLTLAISASNPLSLVWALDEFVPLAVEAAEAAKN
ncbi:ABC transporter substrate-binding protein [Zafaria sp. Z1313]|uniref:ABC transporter substrate-binding protein n=1 Tax=Zafaria sp. Z1313 TaxID=3423202 RepID=UPI003D30237F